MHKFVLRFITILSHVHKHITSLYIISILVALFIVYSLDINNYNEIWYKMK